MSKYLNLCCVFLYLSVGSLFAAQPPQAEISNGVINAKFYLPDPQNGYYRATRFDWSGVIYSLTYSGHEYFGKWFVRKGTDWIEFVHELSDAGGYACEYRKTIRLAENKPILSIFGCWKTERQPPLLWRDSAKLLRTTTSRSKTTR